MMANAVAPSPVDTPMTRVLHSPEFRQNYTDAIPNIATAPPGEIAAAVAYLASDAAAYVTGIAIPVDGGFLASGARNGILPTAMVRLGDAAFTRMPDFANSRASALVSAIAAPFEVE